MAQAKFDVLRSLAFGGISGAYAVLGSPLGFTARMFKITNNTNGDLFVSTDGVNNMLFIPAGSFVLYDCATNAANVGVTDNFLVPIATQFYVKQSTAPSAGAVYLEVIYAFGGP
jgi:hypothetical protein